MLQRVGIGLDIGSSAVRAAEVAVSGDRRVIRRFAQVGLQAGAVVEGEVQDRAAVADALKRLWQHGGFSGKRVVVAVGSQRAMVRQVEMPPMPEQELRSALQFKIGELLPIPVEQAVTDFALLPGSEGTEGPRKVLLVAAQREVVLSEVAAVEAAGLKVRAVDAGALALLRSVGPQGRPGSGGPGGGLEAVIVVGSQLLTVAVREAGAPRFIRTVALSTSGPGQGPSDAFGATESGRGHARRSAPGAATRTAGEVSSRLDAVVSEVRSSLEYLLSQDQSRELERVLLTGGGSLVPGVGEAVAAAVNVPVERAVLPFEVDAEALGLDATALADASFRWMTAAGLALWGTDELSSISLVPAELVARRRQRRLLQEAAASAALVVVAAAAMSYSQLHAAGNLASQIAAYHRQESALELRIKALGYVTKVPAEVQAARGVAQEALAGDIDWTGLLARLATAMPGDVAPQSIELSKLETAGTNGLPSAPPPGSNVVGSLALSAETTGGAHAVAEFIDRVSRVKGLQALWVSSTNGAQGMTTIAATAQVTTAAFSDRAARLPGGIK